MKKNGIINPKLMGALAGLGHTDRIVICDAGLSIPKECDCVIDLTLVKGIPSFIDTIGAVLNEIIVEKIAIFGPMEQYNSSMYETLNSMLPKQEKVLMDQIDFAEEVKKAKVIVRTAEFAPCCNVILYSASGVEEMCAPLNVCV